MSRNISCGWRRAAMCSAVGPSLATSTTCPISVNSSARVAAATLSSTTMTRRATSARAGGLAAMLLGQAAHQRQADSQSARMMGRAPNLGEHVEHGDKLIRRDADPVVAHRQEHVVAFLARGQGDAARHAACTWRRC
nr:hypothetical protein [Massilia genomosp. 1]